MLQPANQPVTNFDVLEIKDFTSNLADEDSLELANRFADRLHTAVMRDREQNPGQSVFDAVLRESDRSERVLTLDGTVINPIEAVKS